MTRVAVLGVGAIGRNHARVYREMANVELVGVADPQPGAADNIARLYGTRAYTDHRALLEAERPEAVTVSVPTYLHFPVVNDALAAGCHVLVEKPIAATPDEALAMIATAEADNRVLMVGHIERYNPAIIELRRRLVAGELGRVFQIHTRRLGPFPPRVRDVGVVVDLATHDIDAMRYLTGHEVTRLYAETRQQVHTSNEDLFSGMLRFSDDTLGILEINWLTPTKIRELWVTGERGMFRADYLTQDLYFYQNPEADDTHWGTLSVLRGVSEGAMTRFAFQKREPMRAEQEAFIAAVNGDRSGIVSGQDGLAALRIAQALVRSGKEHQLLEIEG